MTDGAGHELDPGGEARSVLQAAVSDFGTGVLSDAAIIDGVCEDRLPDWPREASLISTAARADVAAMLQQQAGGVGTDAAVRLTAATLAEGRSLDPAACVWVVSEFARALGYQVSEGLRPAGASGTQPPGAAPPAPGAAAPGGPGLAAAPPAAGPPGESLTAPPATGMPPATGPPPPAGMPDFGHAETVSARPGQPPPAGPAGGAIGVGVPGGPPGQGTGPQAGPGMPGGPIAPRGGRPPGRRRLLLALAAAAALLVVYFIVAGVARLPPFSKTAEPSPSPTGSRPTTAGPTGSASASPTRLTTAADRTLAGLIPAGVAANGSCSAVHPPRFGATAEMHCAGAPGIPAGYVQYYLFGSAAALSDAYSTFLAQFAHTTKNTGRCHRVTGTAAFSSFMPPCETEYSLGSTPMGRIVEYIYKRVPDISCTYTRHLVLADMQGRNGNALVTWWDHLPNWLVRNGG